MLNQIVIVGRLVRDPELRQTEGGKKVTNITLAVPRSYKNSEGVYETDFIDCVLWTGIAENTTESEDEKKRYTTEVVAEKVSFLSPSHKAEES